jgi:xylulokinase
MYLGIDIGTSGVKSVLVDDDDRVIAEASAPLAVDRPRPRWSEQHPETWFDAVARTLDALADGHTLQMAKVLAVGLSAQMLGVAPIDREGRALRPALLWNDRRATEQCRDLEAAIGNFADLVGCRAMPGFSAPKILWLARHEPDVIEKAKAILLTKDYVRLRLTGEIVTDLADGSATLLMDTRAGEWDDGVLAVCGIRRDQVPRIVASDAIAGVLRADLAARWRLPSRVPVVGGAGDNMCGGVGAGVVDPGAAYIGLGTSGIYFAVNDRFLPAFDRGMHTHRHAVAQRFCQHGVVLSAAAALSWIAGVVGNGDVPALMAEVEALPPSIGMTPVFTPYLAGERTPHDDAALAATFSGLTLSTSRVHFVHAVLEGVALALADCHDAIGSTGLAIRDIRLIGGGARSHRWAELLASAIGRPLAVPPEAAVGPALGAARLARAALGGPLIAERCRVAAPPIVAPRADLAEPLARKRETYRQHLRLGS